MKARSATNMIRNLMFGGLLPASTLLNCIPASAATLHVWQGSPSPSPPYDTWLNAATNIQDAVDTAQASDTVVVTNGVFASGGRAVVGTMTNRVVINKAITVRSVNGPEATLIVGAPAPGGTNGNGAVRCVYLSGGAVLSGFTLTNGHTLLGQYGGGAWCASTAVLTNCVVRGNSSDRDGGGVIGGVLYRCILAHNSSTSDDGGGVDGARLFNCMLVGNTARDDGGGADDSILFNCVLTGNAAVGEGGAAYESELYNCTITRNNARKGGGVENCSVWNCIVYDNQAPYGANYLRTTANYSCTTPLPLDGAGNISADPQMTSLTHLADTSPCIGAGSTAYAFGVDVDGESWLDPPCMGADQYVPGGATSLLSVGIENEFTEVAVGFAVPFQGRIEGQAIRNQWDLGDGTLITNALQIVHAWDAPGIYTVRLTAFNDADPNGVETAVVVEVFERPVYYVNEVNPNPLPPYESWETAATNIQDAIGAGTLPGRLVLVNDGLYATGGVALWGLMTNRVALTNAVVVRSVNGPERTVIQGAAAAGNAVGDGAIRCAFLDRHSVLSGFTLTRGHTRADGDTDREQSGGGAWCEPGGVLTNCVLTGNAAAQDAGGVERGILHDCWLSDNVAGDDGGGAEYSTLFRCVLTGNKAVSGGGGDECIFHDCTLKDNRASDGGGVTDSTLSNCLLTANTATGVGGAVYEAMLFNCIVRGNSAYDGGGVGLGTLYNCTLVHNTASHFGGGAFQYPSFRDPCTLYNCILYDNTAPTGANYYGDPILSYSCTTPLPAGGVGNITNEPAFLNAAAGDFHLAYNSPCIDAGTNLSALLTNDLDGKPRPLDGDGDGIVAFDMGAYEHRLLFAAADSPSPSPPYDTWLNAATNIQDAVDVAQPGDTVLVTNGVYATGGRSMPATDTNLVFDVETNRLVVNKPITLQSVMGPEVTLIVGFRDPHGYFGAGSNAVRCVYLGEGSMLVGFTLTNGAAENGGGVWCLSSNAVISDCVLTGNAASGEGGGVYGGAVYDTLLTNNFAGDEGGGAAYSALTNCILMGNSAYVGGGVYGGIVFNCTITGNSSFSGGGAHSSTLNNCMLASNAAEHEGGGARECILYNCTLTENWADQGGGTVGGTLYNCSLTDNFAENQGGGGAAEGILYNCTLTGNSTRERGGAVDDCELYNCTLTGNSAGQGGGARGGTLYNCIVYHNLAADHPNYLSSTLNYSCTTPLPAEGSGNIADDPQLASATHLATGSPCIGAGSSTYTSGVDIDGDAWLEPPCIGADQYVAGMGNRPLEVSIQAAYTNVAVGFAVSFTAQNQGPITAAVWDFGGGTLLTNQPFVSYAWTAPGTYLVRLTGYSDTFPTEVTATAMVHVVETPVYYVDSGNSTPAFPYTTWQTAATNIQDAIGAGTEVGRLVLVTNGIYQSGGTIMDFITTRVALTNPVVVRSVNGPGVTVIRGTNALGADVRCAWVGENAVLSGFTLENGRASTGGGGASCDLFGVLTNCMLTGNWALSGGGTLYGTLYNCTLSNNSADVYGGGAWRSILNGCTLTGNTARYGGGASESTLNGCTLTDNEAGDTGGGVYGSTLCSCQLIGNVASYGGGALASTLSNSTLANNSASGGGGAAECWLYNCLITGNSGGNEPGGGADDSELYNCTLARNSVSSSFGGGVNESVLRNCIVYFNLAASGSNYSGSTLHFSCTLPLPGSGVGNITNEPVFLNAAAGDFHLVHSSPCIDAGTNLSALLINDLDGKPRPLDGNGDGFAAFDMGAYEFDLRTEIPSEWLVRYGLDPSDPHVVSGDPDNDSLTTFQEWQADTDPTNGQSFFRIDHIEVASNGAPASVHFLTSSNRHYTLFSAADLDGVGVAWMSAPEQTAVPGSGGMDSLSDTNAAGRKFYKVGVDAQPYYLRNMVWIPPGTFLMGSPIDEAERDGDETQHEVTISRGYWMGKYEVTQGEYLELVGSNPSYFRNGRPPFGDGIGGPVTNELQHPVEQLTWIDATNYCALLTERERAAGRLPDGYVYRLATEAEWEYACRAGTITSHHYGDELRSGWASFDGRLEYDASIGTTNNPEGIFLGWTTEVGSYEPNAWGLYDMDGNAVEWCQDWYGMYPVRPVTNPTGPGTGDWRVNRGGNWRNAASLCRSARRGGDRPDDGDNRIGFRVVLGHPYPVE